MGLIRMIHCLPSHIREAIQDARLNPGATTDAVASAATQLGIEFPSDYVALMVETDGAEFYLGESCVIFYSVQELLESNQPDVDFPKHLKCFGSNGGSEKFAFDGRSRPHPIVVVPHYRPADGDAVVQGTSLVAFLDRVLKDEAFN